MSKEGIVPSIRLALIFVTPKYLTSWVYTNLLSPNDQGAKNEFRQNCGDHYFSGANIGSALYIVFDIDAKSYSSEERESVKGKLGLKLGDYFSSSGAISTSSEFQDTLTSLKVKIHADQIGGPPGLAATITSANVLKKYTKFVQGTNEDNWHAVDISTNIYSTPEMYRNYSHEEIFANYAGKRGPLAQFRHWADLSVQLSERCNAWTEYGQARAPAQCGTSLQAMSTVMDTCRKTDEWDECTHPYQYRTGIKLKEIFEPGTYLYGWLSTNIKKLNHETKSQDYKHHQHSGDQQVNDKLCLSSSECFGNIYRGTGEGIGKGFSYKEYVRDNPKNDSKPGFLVDPQNCVKSSLYLNPYNTGFFTAGDTTADWNYTMKYEGLCPQIEEFVIIP